MEIVLILDNIRSLYNVGSIFRSSDAFGVQEIICAGYTPTPEHPDITKTALGAESTISWRTESVSDAVQRLKKDGYVIAALETGGDDISAYRPPKKIVIILGNEVEGIPPEHLKLADVKLEIPMRGTKESLNVSIATGIALYALAVGSHAELDSAYPKSI